ncbi:MAG: glucosamine-6-phosphate deaminase [Pseudomonadota bacterium]
MEIVILPTPNDVAEFAAARVCELLGKKPSAVLGLATGSTQIRLYRRLVALYRESRISFRGVTTFNLDEYLGVAPTNPQSYRAYMQRELFDAVDIDPAKTWLPVCREHADPRAAGAEYERLIRQAGGIDLQILGLGRNGHIGFNEPASSLASRTRVKSLTADTMAANKRLFAEGERQPNMAMTMGVASILDSRNVMLLATGGEKAEAALGAIEGPVSAMCPASALQLHANASLVLDEAAAARLAGIDDYRRMHAENSLLVERLGHFSR